MAEIIDNKCFVCGHLYIPSILSGFNRQGIQIISLDLICVPFGLSLY